MEREINLSQLQAMKEAFDVRRYVTCILARRHTKPPAKLADIVWHCRRQMRKARVSLIWTRLEQRWHLTWGQALLTQS